MEGNKVVKGANKTFNYIISASKASCLFLFALLLPRLFFTYIHTKSYDEITIQVSDPKLKIEEIPDCFLHAQKDIAHTQLHALLITNKTNKNSIHNTFLKKGINIKTILHPQNVLKKINNNTLKNTKIIIVDIQITGIRNYINMNTLLKAIDMASKYDKKIIIIDRPNIVGPIIEGPLVKKSLNQKMETAWIPLRYGMTPGEVALFYNNSILKKPAMLHVIPIKNTCSCHGLTFLNLFKEIKPFYVGTGTKLAFQLLLLPEHIYFPQKHWQKLHNLLKTYGIKSRFYTFFDKEKKIHYNGLKIKFENIHYTSSFKLCIQTLLFFKNNGVMLTFSDQFDQIVGTDKVRQFLENKLSWRKLTKYINKKLYKFYSLASAYFIYKPFPRIEYLR